MAAARKQEVPRRLECDVQQKENLLPTYIRWVNLEEGKAIRKVKVEERNLAY